MNANNSKLLTSSIWKVLGIFFLNIVGSSFIAVMGNIDLMLGLGFATFIAGLATIILLFVNFCFKQDINMPSSQTSADDMQDLKTEIAELKNLLGALVEHEQDKMVALHKPEQQSK